MGKRATTAEFIERALKVHGDKYDYSSVEYLNSTTKVVILCKIHGKFLQQPSNHLAGHGCPECTLIKITTEEFVRKANKVHSNKYLYKITEYVRHDVLIDIVCKEHGNFQQLPVYHLQGSGCPACSTRGFDTTKSANIYVLQSDDMLKIGITNKSVDERIKDINRYSPQKFSTLFYKTSNGRLINELENRLILWLRSEGFKQPTEKFSGYTECFYIGHITFPQIIDKLLDFEKEITNDSK